MLIVDHILNGEVTWMYPFFTALETEGGGLVMLKEMLTVGVPMSVIVTVAWAAWAYAREIKNSKLKIQNYSQSWSINISSVLSFMRSKKPG